MPSDRVPLEASRPQIEVRPGSLRPADHTQVLEATILVRRRPDPAAGERIEKIMRGEAPPIAREQAAEVLGASAEDIQHVSDFATQHGLRVVESSSEKRSVRVAGTVAQMQAAFGVALGTSETAGGRFLAYEGAIMIPLSLQEVIVGVLGLDQRPAARQP